MSSTPASARVLLCGVDTLVGSAYGDLGRYALRLDDWKRQAQVADRAGMPFVVDLAGESFRVRPTGVRSMPYVLEHERGVLMLAPRSADSASKRPTLQVQMRAEALHGPDGPVGELAFWEAVILPELFDVDAFEAPLQISRGDVHVDLAGASFELADLAGFVCRADKRFPVLDVDQLESVGFGRRSAPVFGRLYDKLRQIEVDGGGDYLLQRYGLAGLRPGEQVWRLEFEMHRESLVEMGILTVRDFVERAGDAWLYCVGGDADEKAWLWLGVPGTATRRERCRVDDRWLLFRRASFAAGCQGAKRVRRERHAVRLPKYLPVLRGCAVKAGAQIGAPDFEVAWRRLGILVRADAEDRGIDLDVQVVLAELESGVGLGDAFRELARLGVTSASLAAVS